MLWAGVFFEQPSGGRVLLKAMPVMLGVLCVLAIAYRYYSKFLARKVACLDDARPTPAHTLRDGQNYDPTGRWVLFGHHFAAISGAGPLIGPVLAIQFGYMPGLLWLLIGVCLAGAVQDMLVLAASVRRQGKSLAEIARAELGPWANLVVSAAILFIVIIALAGLGIVVVKALGGEEVKLVAGMQIRLPDGNKPDKDEARSTREHIVYHFPAKCQLRYPDAKSLSVVAASRVSLLSAPLGQGPLLAASTLGPEKIDPKTFTPRPEAFLVQMPAETPLTIYAIADGRGSVTLPAGCKQIVKGSSWGTFTIACTIPIALFVGLYMYRIRPGRVVEASLIGAAAVVAVTVFGRLIPDGPLEPFFSLTRPQTIIALVVYGFVASVLPVWLLLCPRDYLSSFLKIGTIALLVVGVIVANPTLEAPPLNQVFQHGGPTFKGDIFPFVFICIMCGAVSGFHALVSSGTTPKMINKESDVRPIGYGAMLMEGLVAVVALIAAASLESDLYFQINTDLSEERKYQEQFDEMRQKYGSPLEEAKRHSLADVETLVGGEQLRGRTGGAVTLAVGMALIFTDAMHRVGLAIEGVMQYWYHFAIMFEALFILTTIDAGTRIARFLLQEAAGKINPKYAKTDWLPGAIVSTLLVTGGWGALIATGSIDTIWPMFGIANQLLAVIALALVTTLLINSGRQRYAWVTLLPMLWVISTTMTAGVQLVTRRFPLMISQGKVLAGTLNIAFTIFVMACVGTLLLMALARWTLAARQGARSNT
jgi:carbon starvation protein